MIIAEAIRWGSEALKANSDSARLDAEILLRHLLHCSPSYLFSHPEYSLSAAEQQGYQELIERRQKSEPIAYLVGHKEFWSLDLQVTRETLIPRPETELIVELVLQLFPDKTTVRRVADLGTGSGALALALGSERPAWEIYASDQSAAALGVAAQNAANLSIKNVHFCQGSWCAALPSFPFDAIVSNPPYLAEREWQSVSKELTFEPSSALIAGPAGLDALCEIVATAKKHLHPGAYLLLEHGAGQAAAVRALFEQEGYTAFRSYRDLAGIERVTSGCKKSEK